MKYDITKTLQSVDHILNNSSLTKLQRQYLTVYKRHSLSEVTGQINNIFEPGMMVEDPYYRIQFRKALIDLKGRAAVRNFYENLGGAVILHENQEIYLSESSFTYRSTLFNHMTGAQLISAGEKVDPEGYFVKRSEGSVMLWTFDSSGRLIGEFGGEVESEIIQISAEEFITPQEAREKLIPLILPLPEFNSLSN